MKEEINFSPKVVIFEDGGSLAPNIPSPYKFNGTKIFRDTTALPFQKGGPLWGPYKDKKEEQAFQKFYNTLPDNLMQDDPEYDIRGYWDSEGRPEEFNYNQPKEEGYYHASSINGNTGEYLKSPTHPTFQHAIDEDRKMGYRPITNVYGRNIATKNESIINPEEQSFLRNTVGPTNFLDGGPLVEKTNHGKLLNSIYASDLGPYHYDMGGNMQQSSPCPPGSIWDGTKCVPEEEFRAGAAANLPAGFAPDAAIKMNQNYSDSSQWTKDYMDSPMYKQMLKNSTKGYDEEYQTIKEGRQNNLAGISPLKFAGQPEGDTSTGGETDMSTGQITAFPLGANLKTLTGHELSHAVNRNPGYGDFIPKNDEDYMIENAYTKYNQSPKYTERAHLYESNPKLEKEDAKTWEQQYRDQVGIPDETVARLRAIRQAAQQNNIYDPYNEKINTEQFQKLQNTPLEENPLWDPLKQLQGTYPNDKIYEMLNTISQNKTDNSNSSVTARNGGFIPYKRYDLFDNSLKNGGQFSGSYSLPEDSFRQGGNNLHNSVYASSAEQYPAIRENGGPSCPEGTQWDNDLKTCVKIGLNTLPQVNVSPWDVDMKAEQPTQVSNVLQNLVKKNESNNLKFPGLEPNFNYGPSDAIQSSDWMWQLPIAGKGIGQGIKALGELGGMAIPGLAGTTLGNAATAGFAGHGLTNLAMNSPKEWYDVSQGKGDWKEAALNTALHASELMGSGIGKGALNLVGKTGNALKTGYNTVATGNSIIPYAWKSPAVGLSQEKSAAMFDQILNSSKFTDADKALIKEYTYSSTPFTRSGPKQNKFNDLIQRVNTEFPDNAVVTRRFYDDPEMSNFAFESIKGEPGKIKEFSIENRPSSFSTGAGTGNYGKDRIVLSGKNLKKVEDNFVKNTYEGVPEEYYANLPEENLIVKDRSKEIAENSSRIGDNYYGTSRLTPEEIKAQAEALYEQKFANYGNPADREEAIKKIIEEGKTSFSGNSSTSKERELMASGFNMKTLGKVKNDIGGFDYIVKPKLQGSSFMDSAVGAAKALTEPVVNYGKDVIGASKAAGKFTLPTYANTYRAEHAGFNIPAVENSLTGRWFANNPEDARFYTSNLKDPITGEVIRNNTAPVRVMKSRLPQHTINENFGINMPEDARIMSMGRGELTNEELVKYLGPGADRRFRNQVFTQGDLNSMQTHPYLFNKSEGILSPRIVNDARSKGIVFENQEGAFQHLNNEEIKIKQNNSLKKYLPFRNGGELSHFYDSNIQAYNNGGNLYDNVLVFKKKI